MSARIKVLILEDNPSDADLLVEDLILAGFDPMWTRVEEETAFRSGLLANPDVVIADYRLPQFDAMAALAAASELAPDIPVIVVSGVMNEEICVQCLQRGAVDYLLKDRLTRLGPAVRDALSRRELRAGRQRAEQAARDAATILQDLVDGSPTPICLTDEHGRFVLVNSEFERIVGLGRSELVGRPPDYDMMGVLAESLAERNIRCLLRRTVIEAEEEMILDGRRNTYLSVRYPLSLTGGKEGVATIYTNISSQKQTEYELRVAQSAQREQAEQLAGANAELKELDQLRTQFLATVSHELRTPLTSIISYSEILASEPGLPPAMREMVAIVERNGRRLLALIEDLLIFAQIDSGKLVLESVATNIAEIVGHCCATVLPAARTASLTIECDIQADLPAVKADPGKLERVLLNLLSNSIKFSLTGGRVTVTGNQADSAAPVVIAVRDTGIGIPLAEQKHLGTRFFRSSISERHAIGGTGLGLAICKAIVEGHGGRLTVASAVGVGTTVSVVLPVAGAPARSVGLPQLPPAKPQDERRRDDEQDGPADQVPPRLTAG